MTDIVQDPSSEHSSRNTQTTIIAWVLVALWACFIFFMSSNTSTGLNSGLGFFSSIYRALQTFQESIFGADVDVMSPIAHFCEYMVFGALLNFALHNHVSLKRACVFAVIIASLYGITDEFHQYFVPGRMCDPMDWLVDTLGATLGSILATAITRSRLRFPWQIRSKSQSQR